MHLLVALLAGLVFGVGLVVSGMTDPAKVLGFLDLAGNWDPSLAFVMGGAVLVAALGYRYARARTQSLLGAAMQVPTARRVDRRPVLGSLTFGVGWGLSGFCPGPALASLASGGMKPLLFVLAMVAGMILFDLIERARRGAPPTSART
ncbi:YeeE/YedE family protein [Massilia sp. Se16.2.3]|uniref:YeeE/YedE family protein n=1 Tax=Massilia sp. Se16.2.3 TaxID=2709303 RepID=UPI001603BAA2|nr:YeeE/YedE family protein [Massilia sp. Se16.2.3]QNA97765.1 YeeE/YedE family protein [Massilia sp. Se16.2.3]